MSQKHSIIIVKLFITKLYKLTGRDKGMEKFLVDRIDRTVDNYRLAKEYLKNDGDILNHFASLVFSHYEREIPIDRIKEIRKEIKAVTPRMSPFRGDILYIISLLIATTDKDMQQEIIENTTAIQIIADLGSQVDNDPHISLLIMHLTIGIRHLSVNPGLITINR